MQSDQHFIFYSCALLAAMNSPSNHSFHHHLVVVDGVVGCCSFVMNDTGDRSLNMYRR